MYSKFTRPIHRSFSSKWQLSFLPNFFSHLYIKGQLWWWILSNARVMSPKYKHCCQDNLSNSLLDHSCSLSAVLWSAILVPARHQPHSAAVAGVTSAVVLQSGSNNMKGVLNIVVVFYFTLRIMFVWYSRIFLPSWAHNIQAWALRYNILPCRCLSLPQLSLLSVPRPGARWCWLGPLAPLVITLTTQCMRRNSLCATA